MALSDIVTINISTSSARVERQGFGMPMILAQDVPGGFTERVRFYTDMTGVAVDFPSGATHDMANAVFSQNPKPPKIAVGRRANLSTMRWLLTPVVNNSTVYSVRVGSTVVSYTSDGTATAAEITAGLKTAIDALSLAITTSQQNGNTQLQVVANAAGAHFSLEMLDPTLIGVLQNHADPGLSADLTAINTADTSWYVILNASNSTAEALVISAWAEANNKLFIAQTQESAAITVSPGSDTGGSASYAAQAKTAAYFRTAIIYQPKTDAFADAAWAGKVLPLSPGSETWAFKTLAGVPVVTMTETQHENAIGKMCNTYEAYAGVSVTGVGDQTQGGMGRVSGNEFIDVIRFRDWLQATMQADIFQALANAPGKIPFTDGGISVIEGILRADLKAGVDVGGLVAGSIILTVPKASAVSGANRSARILTPINFDAQLAGAVQAVNVSGAVHV